MRFMRTTGIVCGVLGAWSTFAKAGPALTDKDCVVFYGDSAVHPPNVGLFVEQFFAIRYPELKTRFWHVGPRGRANSATGLSEFDNLVPVLAPSWIVLSFGSVDTAGKPISPALYEQYIESMSGLIDRCQASGAKVALLTPPRPEIKQKKLLEGIKYDEVLRQYSDGLAKLAKEKEAALLDWNSAMTKYAAERAAQDPPVKLTRDGTAPNEEGLALAVDLLLTLWGAEPITLSVHADWNSGVMQAEGCKATMSRDPEGTRQLQLSEVPVPWGLIGRRNAFDSKWPVRRYCRMTLKLDNAPPGKLKIGTPTTAAWLISTEDLAQGYDLASGSPLFDDGNIKTFFDRITKKNEAHRNLDAFDRRAQRDPPPEPELAQAYATHRLAWQQYIDGWMQVLARAPRRFNIAMEIKPAEGTETTKDSEANHGH